jgi:hypothetical protein
MIQSEAKRDRKVFQGSCSLFWVALLVVGGLGNS